MKVAKFGGSSVASAEQLRKVAQIVKADQERKIIVVSAPGKRDKADTKVTDLLIAIGEAHSKGEDVSTQVEKVLSRFRSIVEELELDNHLIEQIADQLKGILADSIPAVNKMDALKATGEDSLAKVFSAYLNKLGVQAAYVNPQEAGLLVREELGGARILDESFELLYKLRDRDGVLVIPGFFGYTKEGKLATFPRGGSDITGSIVSAGVKASLYENFTDVDSVYSVNPNIVDNPKEINTLTYREMRELSYAGFSVFHDEALIPAFQAKIPVCVKNTNNPSASGTMIVAEREVSGNPVIGIASDTGFLSIYISKYLMNRELGFGRKLLQILEEENISFEHAPSGIDDMSVILRESQLPPDKEAIVVRRLKEELQADQVSIDRELAMIMIVGEGMIETIGVSSTATKAFTDANVNIEMINQGSSEVSLMFGVKARQINEAVQSLYTAFFQK
ncbi:aspartate kinase [Terribacillus saccharophilus]|uniref:Aspartokinase n=1 Tax=Terribacillus saccharophilus TaxID=361277 RepID=A0A268HG09_9BACI|nr:aspartate kinase [Terribacillus saccharophilus]PAE08813.1 aspartate kinase [Terribacillus saccharophilus]